MTSSSSVSSSTKTIGNVFHVLNLTNIIIYGTSVYWSHVHSSLSLSDLDHGPFDAEWFQHGFCLPDKETRFWTTHDVSCYIMLLISFMGLGLIHCLHKDQNMEQANKLAFWAIIGGIGHGLGHALIANSIRIGIYPHGDVRPLDDFQGAPLWLIAAKIGPGMLLFWAPLVKTYMMNTAKGNVFLVVLLIQFFGLFVPMKFGFPYTQSVLFAGLSIDQLFRPASEKGFEYALWPLMTVIPSGIFGWIEATGCTTNSLMLNYGGHLPYDVFMASSYPLFYLVCWLVKSSRISMVRGGGVVEKVKSV